MNVHLLRVGAILFIAACSSDDAPPIAVVADASIDAHFGNATMSATIEGVPWTATLAVAGSIISDFFSVSGGGLSMSIPDIAFGGPLSVGTFPVGPAPGGFSVSFTLTQGGNDWMATDTMGSGRLTVTSATPSRAAGTFEFVAVRGTSTRTVTDGVFAVTRFNR
jgi:hypothetical protein